ncbi:DUF421 domain-containing protein [Microvirga soli]|uniref:DUF421 domain-containing protein n=1 Tax=Microvirga soli TaxID=1854496 RepID=UPI00191DF0A8|nr:YetF domain-containing protein [Microvirga soli]
MDQLKEIVREALGLELESSDINVLQMGLHAAVAYVVTVFMVRPAKKHFIGRATAFDVILGTMIESIVSGAVTGNAPFLPALAVTAVLLGMHWLFSGLALRWHGFGTLVKGKAGVLVRKGDVDTSSMRALHLTEHDLWEDLRGKGISRPDQVEEARLGRSSKLSVLKAASEPKVVDVMVRVGVQTVRIEIRT